MTSARPVARLVAGSVSHSQQPDVGSLAPSNTEGRATGGLRWRVGPPASSSLEPNHENPQSRIRNPCEARGISLPGAESRCALLPTQRRIHQHRAGTLGQPFWHLAELVRVIRAVGSECVA